MIISSESLINIFLKYENSSRLEEYHFLTCDVITFYCTNFCKGFEPIRRVVFTNLIFNPTNFHRKISSLFVRSDIEYLEFVAFLMSNNFDY